MWRYITPGTLCVLIVLGAAGAVAALALALQPTAAAAVPYVFGAVVCLLVILFADGITDLANLANHDYRPGWQPTPAWILAGFSWLALIALGVAAVVG